MRILNLNALVAGGLAAAFVAAAAATAHASPSLTPPSVIAVDQAAKGGEIRLDYAFLPSKGYAVIYGADADGAPVKKALGVAELAPGDHRGVKVKLDSVPKAGTSVWVGLYSDSDAKPGFTKDVDASFFPGGLPQQNRILLQ